MDNQSNWDITKWEVKEDLNGHKFGVYLQQAYQCCRICGDVRDGDSNPPCTGVPVQSIVLS